MAFFARLAASARFQGAALVVLVVCLTLTTALAVIVWEVGAAREATRFSSNADRVRDDITERLGAYVALLNAGAGLFAAYPSLQADQFRAFVARLELFRRYPGIQGVGYTVRVKPAELPAFVAGSRATYPGFRVWPSDARPEYHSILFLEPLDRRNRAAIGFDMFTEAVRRDAMERARDSGQPAASGPVTLVQEIDPHTQSGFLLYVPVYSGGRVPPTVAERRANLSGFVYSPFRIGDFMNGIFGTESRGFVGFELYDRRAPGGELLFRTRGFDRGARLTGRRLVHVPGREWVLQLSGTSELRSSASRLTPLVLLLGVSVSALLTALTARQARARRRLERSESALSRALGRERALRAEAERAGRIKDEFLATLSHELRTPLNAIIGWNHLMIEGHITDEIRRKALATVQRNARLQARLIDDLLDMSRIISGKVQLDTREVDLNEVIDAALTVVRPAASAKRIAIEAVTDRACPRVSGDAGRLQQVLWNLLTNAVKFTSDEGRVHVELRHTAADVQIVVADSGIGIDPAFVPYVFDRFRQADGSSTRQHGGLGLGLSIVKSLVEMHGGTVRAESPGLGRGTTFTVVLPAVAVMPAGPPVADRQTGLPDGTNVGDLTGVRVLLIEDDADGLELARTILERHGARVTAVMSVDQALERLDEQSDHGDAIDLVVSDLGMPGRDGFELVRELRARDAIGARRTPAIALSAYARAEDRARSLAAGFDGHVPKPFQPHDLVSACADALARFRRASSDLRR